MPPEHLSRAVYAKEHLTAEGVPALLLGRGAASRALVVGVQPILGLFNAPSGTARVSATDHLRNARVLVNGNVGKPIQVQLLCSFQTVLQTRADVELTFLAADSLTCSQDCCLLSARPGFDRVTVISKGTPLSSPMDFLPPLRSPHIFSLYTLSRQDSVQTGNPEVSSSKVIGMHSPIGCIQVGFGHDVPADAHLILLTSGLRHESLANANSE